MTVERAKEDLSLSSRILAHLGILDAFGHVSCRTPGDAASFLMSRSLAPKRVRPPDVVQLGLDGELKQSGSERLFIERFIHSEIYRARPDVSAIVHSHAPSILPFTAVKSAKVQPLCHLCGFLSSLPDTYDLADHFGSATDLLIRDRDKGISLAGHLGDANVVLMRGHGFTVTGQDIPQATFRAFYTAKNCELQLSALQLGEPKALSDEEARACEEVVNGQIGRAWDLWVEDITGSK
ncbi:HCOMODA/2-hydroxy-3-carboxy-muconic semialdehyde decarboxylase [Sphingobium sp. JAI105]|uniref:class II aldolase/adducin family protein n=1 Tax=Sphingobium sp. JAI105 TaxID=2787715 RepID=UPI0018CB042A|nr:class II aldolase/adducin family protein [Sphingobium sp. JAI105]MBG6118484.1 HCOMODA/2-hydroxy-3-carboxy-muconic semialdehyde decarboxylase [Sphingobium sp. JAI105]